MLSDYSGARFKPENLIFYSRHKKKKEREKEIPGSEYVLSLFMV